MLLITQKYTCEEKGSKEIYHTVNSDELSVRRQNDSYFHYTFHLNLPWL